MLSIIRMFFILLAISLYSILGSAAPVMAEVNFNNDENITGTENKPVEVKPDNTNQTTPQQTPEKQPEAQKNPNRGQSPQQRQVPQVKRASEKPVKQVTRELKKHTTTEYEQNKFDTNKDTIGIITGPVTGTYIRIGADLADVFDGDKMRLLPIVSKGSLNNITDILFLKGVDIGIIQADALAYFKKTGEHPEGIDKIKYVTKLYNEETHILARKEYATLTDLKGKKVNFDKKGSGTFVTASTIFTALKLDIEVTNYDQRAALEKLKSGELAAMVFVAGKPSTTMESVFADSGLHLVSIPYDSAFEDIYFPSTFTAKDYPAIISGEDKVTTVATSAVMAVYNWEPGSERYERVTRFIEALFNKFPELQKPGRHPKWQELSLTAKVPGWERYGPAEKIVASILSQSSGGASHQKPDGSEPEEQKKSDDKPEKTGSITNSSVTAEVKPDNETEETKKPDEPIPDEKKKKIFNDFENWMKKNNQ